MHRMTRLGIPWLLALLGCGSEHSLDGARGNVNSTPSRWHVDVIVPASGADVDVLFVLDSSGSMDPYNAALAANATWFIEYFVDSAVDYHVGVVTTDVSDPVLGGQLRAGFGHTWVDLSTPDPIATFLAMADVGVNGPQDAAGLAAVQLAHDGEVEGNTGFFRDSASLHVVVVSNEHDYSYPRDPDGAGTFVAWFDGLHTSDAQRSFSSIQDGIEDKPALGTRYADVTRAVGGSIQDINHASWTAALAALRLRAVYADEKYHLSREPVPSSIRVTLREPDNADFEDVSVPRKQITYLESVNAIELDEPPPSDQTEVWIEYRPR